MSVTSIFLTISPMIICFIVECGAPMCDVWILYWNQQIESVDDVDDVSTIYYLIILLILLQHYIQCIF